MGIYSDMERSHVNDVSVKTEEATRKKNRELCQRFPFLIPRNVFSGKKITDCLAPDGDTGYWPETPDDHPTYDYEYTVLDNLPGGWRAAFGEEMSADIQAELDESDPHGEIYVLQMKEKYGKLSLHMSDYTPGLAEVVERYKIRSMHTCIECGAPATVISARWLSPLCDDCATENGSVYGSYAPIKEGKYGKS